ncbi:MAG: putative porin [Cyclobacteriaceae bacterium]
MSNLSLRVFFRIVIAGFFLLLSAYDSFSQGRTGSQIVDDSTRNVYGPNTTRWTTEEDIFYNRKNFRAVDTAITNYHRWTYVQRFNNLYKDLGNIGTALYPLFPQLSTTIGVSTGFSVYDQYYLTEEPKYFDTKSPYTRMKIIWGGEGRATTGVEFSRNINPRWNFGFNFRSILIDRQIERVKNEKQTKSYYYDLYSAYQSENKKYQLALSLRRIRHRVEETGGVTVVLTTADSTYKSLFNENNRTPLSATTTEQLQTNAHIFHQYRLGEALQVYHKMDLGRKINLFKVDPSIDAVSNFDPRILSDSLSPDQINDSTRFFYWTNEGGVKGKVGRIFYNGYVKTRQYNFSYKYLTADTLSLPQKDLELYVGGRISYEYDSVTFLSGWLEFLTDGNYLAEAKLNSRWIDATVRQTLSKPSFLHTAYRGTFDEWSNNFNNTFSTQAQAFAKISLGSFKIAPGFTYTGLSNFIYFRKGIFENTDQTVLPVQSSGTQQLLSPELRFEFNFWKNFYLRPQVIYSTFLVNDDNALRVPELFVNTQLAYESHLFKRNLQVQIGVDLHWKSSYFDLSYDPVIQSYYVQDEVAPPSFPLTDIFFNAKMKRGRFFFKYHNLVQAITQSGYLPTPIYPGQRNILDFGFELLLFD